MKSGKFQKRKRITRPGKTHNLHFKTPTETNIFLSAHFLPMIAYGRFVARGEIHEGFFEIKEIEDGEDGKGGRQIRMDDLIFSESGIRFLPPVEPTKIICVGLNYRDHAEEFGMEIPEEPVLFLKPPSAVIGDGEPIELPNCGRVDYEGELAVVIARKCKNVSRNEALSYVLGYTCFNDVTARDLQRKDGQWTRSKSFDTFAPMGPYVACIDDPSNLKIETRVNGVVKQSSTTSNLIFDVPALIEFVSGIMTLRQGDVIATGTPSGVGPLTRGDVVEVEIEGIGVLRNYVADNCTARYINGLHFRSAFQPGENLNR